MDIAEFCQSFEGIIESYTKIIAYMAEDNRWLQEENNKLRAESVCHGDQCRLDEIERLRQALEIVCSEMAEHNCPEEFNKIEWLECGICTRLYETHHNASRDIGCWKRWALEKARQALERSGDRSEANTV